MSIDELMSIYMPKEQGLADLIDVPEAEQRTKLKEYYGVKE